MAYDFGDFMMIWRLIANSWYVFWRFFTKIGVWGAIYRWKKDSLL